MDQIANVLGISKKTIYIYFEDKNQLVDAVMDAELIKSQEQINSLNTKAKNAIHEILLTMDFIRQDFQNLNPIIIHDLERFYPMTFMKFNEHINGFLLNIIKSNLKKGIEQGFYKASIQIDIMAKYRIQTMTLPFNQMVFPANKYNLIEVTEVLLEHFMYGLVTPKGYDMIEAFKNDKSLYIQNIENE